jgi:hypothetical protein
MTPALRVALDALAARIEAAARTGRPLRTAQAVALLRAAGVPRDQARRLLVTAGEGCWTVGRGQTTVRGGCPPHTVCGNLATAKTHADACPEPVHLRARLVAAAQRVRWRRLDLGHRGVIPGGEPFWQRFVALADVADVVRALRALGVALDAGDATP